MRVAIIDYGSGNLRSATKAFERATREAGLNAEIELTDKADRVATADRIVLPGVGAYADCRRELMSSRGLEKTVTDGFGWIEGDVVEMTPSDASLKIPQIGWNTLTLNRPHPLFDGIPTGPDGLHAYFVHSYHLAARKPEDVIATTDYGGAMTAFVGRDNMVGAQFHPEKSQALGLKLIANFLTWTP
jgi:glutamine amidotransferase